MTTPPAPSRRAVLRATAWTAPAVVVVNAAPAFAASVAGDVTAIFTPTRQIDGVLLSGLVTNSASSDLLVTASFDVAVDPASPDTVLNGSYNDLNGWTLTYFNWVDGTGQKAARWAGSRVIAAGAGAPLPDITMHLASSAFGTSTLTLTAPAPAVVTNPPAVPFGPSGVQARRAAPQPSPTWGTGASQG
ncbi:hypothetical protein INN71_09370 [Nocardioides sp. ChNu-153]|uniref:hypothetical protein n=1 Tax=unclassified Nocardioides TaxID=2615069 RepID=UPI002406EFF0|nr:MULTISPECIES: hypothetical protein [unclassified Nocardioides]MDF9716208.1 hypothetical protein [Nocardioides sp. ChNu-99]MDN7121598.1 hypothetical protein [Nocardioides sp. ChNu-153]